MEWYQYIVVQFCITSLASFVATKLIQFLLRCNHLETLRLAYSVVHSESNEDDVTVFKDTFVELLTTSKSLCYVEVQGDGDELWDMIDFPITWKIDILDIFVVKFFKL